jgi:L,D-peptidoglycan transpeptidase YkuD (ErfK/YbiS/YcfS/YnhG family)
MPRALGTIRVHMRPGFRARGWLVAGSGRVPIALGRSGMRSNKREGDGATPRGSFRLVRLWWQADRQSRPATHLPSRRIGSSDAWCEDPADRRYNRPFRLTAGRPADRLWRDDCLYDLVVEIGHNTRPRVAHRGSAVFIHVARPGLSPTAGCVALPLAALRRLLARVGSKTRVLIQ